MLVALAGMVPRAIESSTPRPRSCRRDDAGNDGRLETPGGMPAGVIRVEDGAPRADDERTDGRPGDHPCEERPAYPRSREERRPQPLAASLFDHPLFDGSSLCVRLRATYATTPPHLGGARVRPHRCSAPDSRSWVSAAGRMQPDVAGQRVSFIGHRLAGRCVPCGGRRDLGWRAAASPSRAPVSPRRRSGAPASL